MHNKRLPKKISRTWKPRSMFYLLFTNFIIRVIIGIFRGNVLASSKLGSLLHRETVTALVSSLLGCLINIARCVPTNQWIVICFSIDALNYRSEKQFHKRLRYGYWRICRRNCTTKNVKKVRSLSCYCPLSC